MIGLEEIMIDKMQDTTITVEVNIDFEFIDTIFWDPSQECTDCLKLNISGIDESHRYTLTLIDVNGCIVTKSIDILINDSGPIYLPNVIQANSENNGVFYPQSDGISIFINKLNIYDRWGTLAFINHDFYSNDVSEGWNGTLNGDDSLPGVYVYYIIFTIDEQEFSKGGTVTLLR